MRGFAVFSMATLLVLIAMPEISLADDDCPPVVYKPHGAECEHTCGYTTPEDAFDKVYCASGYYCKPGYIREYFNGPCIPESECPQPTTTIEPTTIEPTIIVPAILESTTIQQNATTL